MFRYNFQVIYKIIFQAGLYFTSNPHNAFDKLIAKITLFYYLLNALQQNQYSQVKE